MAATLILAAGSMLDTDPFTMVAVAADAGFDGVGLRLSDHHAVADLAALRRHALSRGMSIHDVEVHRIARWPAVEDAGELISRAVAVGSSAVLVVSDLDDLVATIAAVADLTERCRAHGLRLGLEYMAWTTPSHPMAAVEVARATGCQLVVDVLHHVRVGAGAHELDVIAAAGVLGWLQLCDAAGELDATCRTDQAALLHEARHGRLAPGQGELPLQTLLASVPAGTVVSVEVQSDQLLEVPAADRARLLHDAARVVLGG